MASALSTRPTSRARSPATPGNRRDSSGCSTKRPPPDAALPSAGVEALGFEDLDRPGDLLERRRLGALEVVVEAELFPLVLAELVERQDLDPLDHEIGRASCRER